MVMTVMAAARNDHLASAPGTSEREHLAPAPRASKRSHRAGRVEPRRDGSQFHRLANRVRRVQDHERHQIANLELAGQDRDHRAVSARQHRPLGFRDARVARELSLHGQVLRPLHQVQRDILHLGEGQSADNSGHIRVRRRHASRTSPSKRRVHRLLLPRLLQAHDDYPTVQLAQHSRAQRPQRTEWAHDHGRGLVLNEENEAVLPTFLWGELATTVVFLANCPPSTTIGGDTSYYRMFRKHVDLLFLQTFGTYPHGDRQAHLALTSRHTL